MTIWFCHSKTWIGRLIQWITFSKWCHVAIQVGGVIYEADMRGGVRTVSTDTFHDAWDQTVPLELDVPDTGALVRFLRLQLGKDYDWMALVALPWREDWQDPEHWFCSELVAAALVKGGLPDFAVEKSRITPRDLWIMSPWFRREPVKTTLVGE